MSHIHAPRRRSDAYNPTHGDSSKPCRYIWSHTDARDSLYLVLRINANGCICTQTGKKQGQKMRENSGTWGAGLLGKVVHLLGCHVGVGRAQRPLDLRRVVGAGASDAYDSRYRHMRER